MQLSTLKKQAQASTKWRGHAMQWTTGEAFASARCRHCGAWVACEIKPAPNGIEIGGSAVAVNCTRKP